MQTRQLVSALFVRDIVLRLGPVDSAAPFRRRVPHQSFRPFHTPPQPRALRSSLTRRRTDESKTVTCPNIGWLNFGTVIRTELARYCVCTERVSDVYPGAVVHQVLEDRVRSAPCNMATKQGSAPVFQVSGVAGIPQVHRWAGDICGRAQQAAY